MAETLTPLRRDIADAVASAKTVEQARKAVAAVRKDYANATDIADAIFVPLVMGDLAGQLMVYEHEAPKSESVIRSPKQMALGDAQPLDAFLNKPWDEALAYFRERGVLSERELSTLLKGHAETTKEARRSLLEQVQQRVYAMLDAAIEEGRTFQQFASDLAESADGLGITNQDPAYLQTVFRTNVLDAYGAGRADAMNAPAVVEARPFRQIRTAGDARVRDEHLRLDGLTFRSDGPLKDLRPPFGYNCRCSVVTLEEFSGDVATELPAGSVAPGFGGI